MRNVDSVQMEIEHLLVELSSCINDLQGYRRLLSITDAKQAELSLQKLSSIISCVSDQTGHIRLAAVNPF
jgi:hypothetical protein